MGLNNKKRRRTHDAPNGDASESASPPEGAVGVEVATRYEAGPAAINVNTATLTDGTKVFFVRFITPSGSLAGFWDVESFEKLCDYLNERRSGLAVAQASPLVVPGA